MGAAPHGDPVTSPIAGHRIVAVAKSQTADSVVIALVLTAPPSAAAILGMLAAEFALTPREAAVALLLSRHRSAAEIARELGISDHTVRHHLERVLAKTRARTRRSAAALIDAFVAQQTAYRIPEN